MKVCDLERVTFVTSPSYCEGAECLARSLALYHCFDLPVLVVYASISAVKPLESSPLVIGGQIELRIMPHDSFLEADTVHNCTHTGVGALIQVDSPRRFLFKQQKPFIYLDADLLCVSNPMKALQQVLDELVSNKEHSIAACPAFRVKKGHYGGVEKGFNAGVIVCAFPQSSDASLIEAQIAKSLLEGNTEMTEERILSLVFKDRWLALTPVLNLIKRVYKFAPLLWNTTASDAVFVHYIGAKPWITDTCVRHSMDWDSQGYDTLEALWKSVQSDSFKNGQELSVAFQQIKAPLSP